MDKDTHAQDERKKRERQQQGQAIARGGAPQSPNDSTLTELFISNSLQARSREEPNIVDE
jgi:hypothetical protein